MSTNRSLVDERRMANVKQLTELDEGLLAWGSYRNKKFANFTREVYDFPNATISINVGASAGWLGQLAGITNVAVGVSSGTDITGQIGVNEIVGTGIYFSGAQRTAFGQGAHLVTAGMLEGFQSGYFSGSAVYVSPEAIDLLGDVQQITMVETVDAAALIQAAVTAEHSLTAQLRRLRSLLDSWDGEGAQHISEATGETAEQVIRQISDIPLSFLAIPTTRLGPIPDGTIRFECTHGNKELFLTVADKAVEIQAWYPRDSTESVGYWKTDASGAREHLEWLVK